MLEYLNYSSGEKFVPLETEYYTLESVINRPHPEIGNQLVELKSKQTNEIVTFLPSLILPEDIKCSPDQDYSFNKSLPESIVELTINNELIKYLNKMSIQDIKQFFFDVEHGNLKVSDPSLPKKIKRFYSKQARDDRVQIIETLKAMGIGIDDDVWDFYTTEELKKIASKINKK
jgi:hypothetical protein